MEHDYDIRFNRSEPSSDKIAGKRDFEALLARFEAEPKPKPARTLRILPVYWAVAASLALLVSAFFLLRPAAGNELTADQYFAERPYVDPPAQVQAIPPFQPLSTNESYIEEALLQNDEQRLVVSRMSLNNEYGAQPVELHHRTLDEVADFFMAGIPLAYDSAGTNMQLDVTAIVDLYATAGGQRISLTEGTEYGLDLSTTVSAGSDGSLPLFFLYELDTTNRRWTYLSEVPAEEAAEISDPVEELPIVQDRQRMARDYARRIEELENRPLSANAPPQPPLQAAQGQPTLTLDFLNGMTLAEGSNVSPEELDDLNGGSDWQITPESPAINENAFNVEWQQVRLRHLSEDRYELTLINPAREERLIVRPIWLNAGDLTRRQARYEAELAAYQAANDDALVNRDADLAELRRQQATALDAADRAIADYLASLSPAEQELLRRRRLRFQLQLDDLGTYAIARSFRPATYPRSLSLENEDGRPIDNQPIYWSDGRTNSIYRSYTGENTVLPLDDQSTLWFIDEQDQVRVAQGRSGNKSLIARVRGPLPGSSQEFQRLLKE